MEKAERFLQAASRALDLGDWETVASRAYYGVYHAMVELMESKAGIQRQRWDHDQSRANFCTHFADRGFLFSRRQAQDLDSLLESRLIADYERVLVSRNRAEQSLRAARALVDQIDQVIRDA